MKVYHKSNVGDNGYNTSHPHQDIEYYDDREMNGPPKNSYQVSGDFSLLWEENGYLLLINENEMSEKGSIFPVWRGTAYQDREGYRYESTRFKEE